MRGSTGALTESNAMDNQDKAFGVVVEDQYEVLAGVPRLSRRALLTLTDLMAWTCRASQHPRFKRFIGPLLALLPPAASFSTSGSTRRLSVFGTAPTISDSGRQKTMRVPAMLPCISA